jgi:hypothetical protein
VTIFPATSGAGRGAGGGATGDLAARSGNISELRSVMRDMFQVMWFGAEASVDVAAPAGLRRQHPSPAELSSLSNRTPSPPAIFSPVRDGRE